MQELTLLPPFDEEIVAIDLETTGVDPRRDRIIEVGAVKFRGHTDLDTFSSLVNPGTRVSSFITNLTGITQADVDGAPSFDVILDDLRWFVGERAIVAHNAAFDSAFLRSHGVPPLGRVYDTVDLAYLLMPSGPGYGLADLAAFFNARHDNPHRALSDAEVTRAIFLELTQRLHNIDVQVLQEIALLGSVSGWEVGALAGRIADAKPMDRQSRFPMHNGVNLRALTRRLKAVHDGRRPTGPRLDAAISGPLSVRRLFDRDGDLQQTMPEFEYREEQAEMAVAVSSAIQDGEHLLVEAGTGVGKSLAYLVPAALSTLSGGGPVVVSTNTINLQDQLFTKDLPALELLLERLGVPRGTLRVARLKGRANYLCYRRWSFACSSPPDRIRDARLLAKCVVWMQKTATGDRGELALQRDGHLFTRISGSGAKGCPAQDGPCFLRKARNEAQGADIVVVNHSLVLSDLKMGGGLLPKHDLLVIDEAHHLENTATRHFGFDVSEAQIMDELQRLSGNTGVITHLVNSASEALMPLEMMHVTAEETLAKAIRATDTVRAMFGSIGDMTSLIISKESAVNDIRLNDAVRNHPSWAAVAMAWENADLALSALVACMRDLSSKVERENESVDLEASLINIAAAMETLQGQKTALQQAFSGSDPDMICWISIRRGGRPTTVHGAPLTVRSTLREELFERERSVVLTGGTLTDGGVFDHIRSAIGLEGGTERALGSPFDYRKAAIVVTPSDIPEPGQPGYARATGNAIAEIAIALKQRVLVLFTSYSAMDNVRSNIRGDLERQGVTLVAQGVDGPPHRVMKKLAQKPATVALGVSSLWEGVDLEQGSIKALIVTRLPFGVPTEPVFAARSELYEDPFNDYAVPEAVRRFRQGFGRLIRASGDRGSFIVLDRRISSKWYGKLFIESLPDVSIRTVPLADIRGVVSRWDAGNLGP